MTLGKVRHKCASDVKILCELVIIKHTKGFISISTLILNNNNSHTYVRGGLHFPPSGHKAKLIYIPCLYLDILKAERDNFKLLYSSLGDQWISGKGSTYNIGDTGDVHSISGWGRSPGRGHGNPLQYSCLENLVDSPLSCSLVGYSPWGHKESNMAEVTRIYARTQAFFS